MNTAVRNRESGKHYTFPFWKPKQNMLFLLIQTKEPKRTELCQKSP